MELNKTELRILKKHFLPVLRKMELGGNSTVKTLTNYYLLEDKLNGI